MITSERLAADAGFVLNIGVVNPVAFAIVAHAIHCNTNTNVNPVVDLV